MVTSEVLPDRVSSGWTVSEVSIYGTVYETGVSLGDKGPVFTVIVSQEH